VAFSVWAALVSRIMNAMTKATAKEIKVEYFIFSILSGRLILLCGFPGKEINF
jgi:ABC-type antimicrobial peptide transport system permease subunit